MVMVSISETYDLHTQVDKMTLVGIHTPTKELIQKTYPGLCMNSKYFRIDHVDFVLSTAQTMPLGVDQIGLEADKIHPQDMMNPILYKAVSNDSWSTLEARLNGMMIDNSFTLSGSMARVDDDHVTGLADEHGVYYSLLSNRDGFKAAHPQSGLEMRNLVPLVFEKWYTNGENYLSDPASANQDKPIGIHQKVDLSGLETAFISTRAMRGRPHPMPRINTTYITGASPAGGTAGVTSQYNGMGNGVPGNYQIQMPDVPPVMLAAVVLPPVSATTGIIYYRMVCRAYIEFSEVRPIQEITSFNDMNSYYASLVYHSDYDEQSRMMDQKTDMVDIKNGNIEKIMEGR